LKIERKLIFAPIGDEN